MFDLPPLRRSVVPSPGYPSVGCVPAAPTSVSPKWVVENVPALIFLSFCAFWWIRLVVVPR
jgi:hypothetical protein